MGRFWRLPAYLLQSMSLFFSTVIRGKHIFWPWNTIGQVFRNFMPFIMSDTDTCESDWLDHCWVLPLYYVSYTLFCLCNWSGFFGAWKPIFWLLLLLHPGFWYYWLWILVIEFHILVCGYFPFLANTETRTSLCIVETDCRWRVCLRGTQYNVSLHVSNSLRQR